MAYSWVINYSISDSDFDRLVNDSIESLRTSFVAKTDNQIKDYLPGRRQVDRAALREPARRPTQDLQPAVPVPAVFGRRGRPQRRARPPRGGPRQPRRALARRRAARPGRLLVLDARQNDRSRTIFFLGT